MANEPETPPVVPKKKPRRLLLFGALAVVVLASAGGGAYFLLAGPATADAASAEPEPEPTGIIALEPFVVNLADTTGQRFLRITPSLVVSEGHALEVEESAVLRMRVRSAILELLAQQTSDVLVTPEGKADLKKAIAERVEHAADGMHVTDVLLSEFVVQF